MSDATGLWIGREGDRRGPYTAGTLRRWLHEDKVRADTLGWREGMAEWVPLTTLLETLRLAPAAPPTLAHRELGPAPPSAQEIGLQAAAARRMRRERLPQPPSLHWALVLLYGVLTLGIFTAVWNFIQARWVRRIDDDSNATLMLVVGVVGVVIGGMFRDGDGDGDGVTVFGLLLMLASLALYFVAYFSMAASLRQCLPEYGLTPKLGPVKLFLFNVFYLQGQLTWVARWKASGQTLPPPPQRVMFALLAFPAALAIGAAIALPAYQTYVIRAEVAEGAMLAVHLTRAVEAYDGRYGRWPESNASMGLPPETELASQFVSSIGVDAGRVIVIYDNPETIGHLRGTALVLSPDTASGELSWHCSQSTVPTPFLPPYCSR